MLTESELVSIKLTITFELNKVIEKHALTKVALAHKIGTSRAAMDRLLDEKKHFNHFTYP